MFNQIKSLSKALPVRKNPLIKEVKPEISELAVPDGTFKGENIRIAGRRLVFLTLKQCLALEDNIVCFDISYEHELLVSCTEKDLLIWNLKTLEIEQKVEIKLRNKRGEKEIVKITSCAISKDGKYIITILTTKMIVWNSNTGRTSMIHEIPNEIHYIKFSDNDGEYLYSSGEDGVIRTWDWRTGKQTSLKLYHPASVRTFDYTHSKPFRFICGRVDGYCTSWDFEKREIIDNIIPEPTWNAKKNEANRGGWINVESNHTGSILCLRISPNKRLLATGCMDFTCKLWNIASYSKDTETVKQDRLKENIDFNGLIDITLPYQKDGFGIRIGEVPFTTGFHADIMFTFRHEAPVTILEFNSESDILYTGSIDSTCRLWSTRKGKMIFQVNLPAPPQSLYITPGLSNDILYITCQNRLLVLDVKSPTQEKDLPVYWRMGQDIDQENFFYNSTVDNNNMFGDDETTNNDDKKSRIYTGEPEKVKTPFQTDENGNEIDKNDVTNLNLEKGRYTFEEVRKLLSHGLIRDTYIQTMIDNLNIDLPKQQLFSNIKKYNISLPQVLRSIINDKYRPIDVIKAMYTKNQRIMKELVHVIHENEPLGNVMSVLGYKKAPQEELDNAYIYLNNEDIRPITTMELKEMVKNNVFKYAFNQMFNDLDPDTIINEEEMFHKVLHFIPSKQIKLIKDYQKHELSNKIFMEDLDPKKSLPARYPNFKKSDKKPEIKSIAPTSQNIGRVKRFEEKTKIKEKTEKPATPAPEPATEDPLEINTEGYLPLNTKFGQLTKQQRKDLIDLYMDKLFGTGSDKEWKSSGNILHYERYLQAKGLNINWPFPRYQKKKRYPIKDIRNPLLSHVYVQPIVINQAQKSGGPGMSLSQLIVGKKMEIQEKKPDVEYNRRKSSIRPETNTYYRTQFNIPGNSSVKIQAPQKLHRLGDENNYPTLSTHNLSEQIQDLNPDDHTNSYNPSSNFPSFIPKANNNNNEQSIVNSNIRRLSMINNNTLYKMPTGKKDTENTENKKLVFQKVMKISSFNDYKDDIEQIEKAIKLSSSMYLNKNGNSNTVINTTPVNNNSNNHDSMTNSNSTTDNDFRKYKTKQTSPLKNEIKKVTISDEIQEINDVENDNLQDNNNDTITDNNNSNKDIVTDNNNYSITDNNNDIVTENTLSIDNTSNENHDIDSKINDNTESLSNNMEVNDEDFTKTNNQSSMQDNDEINEMASESVIEEGRVNPIVDTIDDSDVPLNDEEKDILHSLENEDPQFLKNDNSENNDDINNHSDNPIDDIDEKTKQEQRDILLANELEDEKNLDYHPFMSSTQKLSSEQKVDEIVVSEDSHKEINEEEKNN